MEDPRAGQDRRTFTPAIVVSGVFVAACAVFAVAFVSARGGLTLPVAATERPAALASSGPSPDTSLVPQPPTPAATLAPRTPAPTILPSPTTQPTGSPLPTPTVAPTRSPAAPAPFVPPTLRPGDPLLALDRCPERPGCFEYVVARGDTLSGIITRYLLDIDVLRALNPGRLDDPDLVVVGQLLLLGRDPFAALEPCPDGAACVRYVVRAGDSLAAIAGRYMLTIEAIRAANPGMATPISVGQVIELPRVAAF